jgi:hypothetical protein
MKHICSILTQCCSFPGSFAKHVNVACLKIILLKPVVEIFFALRILSVYTVHSVSVFFRHKKGMTEHTLGCRGILAGPRVMS